MKDIEQKLRLGIVLVYGHDVKVCPLFAMRFPSHAQSHPWMSHKVWDSVDRKTSQHYIMHSTSMFESTLISYQTPSFGGLDGQFALLMKGATRSSWVGPGGENL